MTLIKVTSVLAFTLSVASCARFEERTHAGGEFEYQDAILASEYDSGTFTRDEQRSTYQIPELTEQQKEFGLTGIEVDVRPPTQLMAVIEGVALDINGIITTDAYKALEGTQLPIAGFKGSGLAWMIDILSGVLTGSSHGGKAKDPFDDFTGPQDIGHLFLTINPELFIGKNFLKEMKKNIALVKKLPKAKGFSSILYPGERKNKAYKDNLNKDISLPA